MTQTLTPPKEKTRHGGGSSIGYGCKVIVLNDDHNTFDGVAQALSDVLPSVTLERGHELATQIHNQGLAIVWSGHREIAELYWEQLTQRGLTMAPLED